ncbi:hypothetical protein TNCT_92251, partial [Trichonephila clavata]
AELWLRSIVKKYICEGLGFLRQVM